MQSKYRKQTEKVHESSKLWNAHEQKIVNK